MEKKNRKKSRRVREGHFPGRVQLVLSSYVTYGVLFKQGYLVNRS